MSLLCGRSMRAAEGPRRTKQPNIVFILADDLGYGDLACYGRTDIKTPVLDGLAAAGVRFTQCYANGPECSPTRTAFMTGRYQQRVGGLECAIGTGNVGRYDDAIRLRQTHDLGLPVEETSIARMLKDAGYATAITGKWHLGYEPKFAPHLHGFDHAFYCIGGGMDYFHYLDNVAGYNLFMNGKPIRREGYFTDLATDEAIAFIEGHTGDPFFLYVPYTTPHSPFQGPDDRRPDPLPLDSALWNQGQAPPDVYIAMIERMDTCIGRILRTLEATGLADDTLVIFVGDNGGTGSARNAPLSRAKGTRIAGVKPPVNRPFDGIDIIKWLEEDRPPQRRTLFWRGRRGARTRWAVREGDLKYVRQRHESKTSEYLFDLTSDIGEQHNLLADRPEDAARLKALLADWERHVRSSR